jgi:cobalt-zinc-cadmium efflux system protein
MAHAHSHPHHAVRADAERGRLALALALIVAFMVGEVVAAIVASSLALLSDAAHMLTDAGALALSLVAARLAARPAKGAMTYGLGRAEILSAQANGVTLLVLGLLLVYAGVRRLISPPEVEGGVVLAVALVGVVVNLAATRALAAPGERSLNVEGAYRHLVTDLFAFVATAVAGAVVLASGFDRADAIASLLVAAVMIHSSWGLLRDSGRVFLEAAPEGIDPNELGRALASQPGVVEVHDLHVWEVTSGFPALSAHVIVEAGNDCHATRRHLSELLRTEFALEHTTLQVEHAPANAQLVRIQEPPS